MRLLSVMIGATLGGGLVYGLDPVAGRRRRALLRDRLTHAQRLRRDRPGATRRDMANRARGLVAELTSAFAFDQPSDDVLAERVRAQLGPYTAHPGAITVAVRDGRVCLTGLVLIDEHRRLAEIATQRDLHDELAAFVDMAAADGIQRENRPSCQKVLKADFIAAPSH